MSEFRNDIYDIAIIGAGFSGSSLCYALGKTSPNSSVVLFDRGQIANGASGNPKAHMIPYITSPSYPGHEFYNHGFQFTADILREFAKQSILPSLEVTPAVQFAANDRPARMIQNLQLGAVNTDLQLLTAQKFKAYFNNANVPTNERLAEYQITFTLDPRELCRSLVDSNKSVVVQEHTAIKTVTRYETQNIFVLVDELGRTFNARAVVLTAGYESIQFCQLPIKGLRGQLATGIPGAALSGISVPLCYNGYYLPPTKTGAEALLGTTYDRGDFSTEPNPQKNTEMIQRLLLLSIFDEIRTQGLVDENFFSITGTRVSFRGTTPDRLPIIGCIAIGLFINAGHGSRGLHSAPIGSAMVAELLAGNDISEPYQAMHAILSPARFLKNNE